MKENKPENNNMKIIEEMKIIKYLKNNENHREKYRNINENNRKEK